MSVNVCDSIKYGFVEFTDRYERLFPIFRSIDASTLSYWLQKRVVSIDILDGGPIIREFNDSAALQYPDQKTLCETIDAIELFTGPLFQPSIAIKEFMIKHQGMKYIRFESVQKFTDGQTFTEFMDKCLDEFPKSSAKAKALMENITFSENDDEINTFVRAPYKIVRNYLYACAFLEETPDLIDRLNALLGYRLGQAIADKKEPAETVLIHLCQELNDFAQSHPDGGFGLCAVFKQDIFGNKKTDTVIVSSDYGTVEVQHEPHLNPVDWENRFRDLSRRYGR